MSKLVCSKCGGTLFKDGNIHTVLTVYVPNGTPPRQESYICVKCGHEEILTYPAVYYEDPKPFEVELPQASDVYNRALTEGIPEGDVCIISDNH